MIYNQEQSSTKLDFDCFSDFLWKNEGEFVKPLTKQVPDLNVYIEKLYRIGTIAFSKKEGKEIEGAVIGYTDNTPDNTSYITQVVVDKQCRGKGVVQALLSEYEEVCKKKGLDEIWLTTEQVNQSAQRAYEKFGFVKSGLNERGLIIYRKKVDKTLERTL